MAITSIKNLKEFSTTNDRFEGAHTLCPGCAHSMIVRELMNCTDDNLVVSANTGCLEVAAKSGFPVCLMHKQGIPKNMQDNPKYNDVLMQVMDFFEARIDSCLSVGIKSNNIILDPGIGFGKTLEHNLILLRNIKKLKSLGYPILIGVSRKTMIGEILNANLDDRLYGSLAVVQFAYCQGAEFFRVHDVKATADVLKTTKVLLRETFA